jgi:hypothetical protein
LTDDSRDRATRAASASIGHTIVLAMVGNNIDRRIIYGRWSISDSSGSRFSRFDLDRSHRSTIISTWKIIGGKWIQKIRKPSGSKRYENLLDTKDTKTLSGSKRYENLLDRKSNPTLLDTSRSTSAAHHPSPIDHPPPTITIRTSSSSLLAPSPAARRIKQTHSLGSMKEQHKS